MAAPRFVAASTGATDAGGAWTATGHAPAQAGNLIVFHYLQDGTTNNASALTSGTNINAIDGTANTWTKIGPLPSGNWPVGGSGEAWQYIWVGRSTGTSAPTASGTNSTSEDLYWRFYEFADVATGTALAEVIENVTSGGRGYSNGTSATASDHSVQTLGPDRLALNFVAVNDDNAIARFTGQTGGDWTEVAEYAESSGTDGAVQLQWAYTGIANGTPIGAGAGVQGTGGTNEEQAQSFPSGSGGSVTGIALWLSNANAPTDDLVVELQTDSGGVPSGTVVGSSASIAASSLTTTATLRVLPVSATLSASTTYWIVLRRTGSRSTTNYFLVSTAYAWASGTAASCSSGTWTVVGGDLGFHVLIGSGTIDGGTASITDSDAWGVVGFALIGTTSSSTTVSGSFTANAVIKREQTGSFAANAVITKTISKASPRSVTVSTAPTGYWRLGELSGTSAVDVMGTQNGQYIGSPTLGVDGATADGDKAVTLNGTSQYVSMADNVAWDVGTSDFSMSLIATITAWPDGTTGHGFLIGRGNAYGAGDYGILLDWGETGRIFLVLAGTAYNFNHGLTLLGTGPHHILITVDRDAVATLYIDGVARGGTQNVSAQSAVNIASSRTFQVGSTHEPWAYLTGTVDEAIFWKGTALSHDTVVAIRDSYSVVPFTADAVISTTTTTYTFTDKKADAVLLKSASQSLTANAVIAKAQASSSTANAFIQKTQSGSFTTNAWVIDTYDALILGETGVVAYLPMPETSGTTLSDIVGNHDGTPGLVGAGSYTFGQSGIPAGGKSVRLTATATNVGAQISLANAFSLGNGPLTYEIWIKRASLPSWWIALINEPTTATPGCGIMAPGQSPANTLEWYSRDAAGGIRSSDSAIADTTSWHHLVFTKSGTGTLGSTNAAIWVDGTNASFAFGTPAAVVSGSNPMYIGSWPNYNCFDGWVTRVAIYDVELTPSQIEEHWSAGSGVSTVSSSLTANAVIWKAQSSSFTANAVLLRSRAGTTTANATIQKTYGNSFTASAAIKKTMAGSTTANAIVLRTQLGSLSANAVIKKTQVGSFIANAVRLKTSSSSFTSNAVLIRSRTGSFDVAAAILRQAQANRTVDAVLKRTQAGAFGASAVLRREGVGSLVAAAVITRGASSQFLVAATLLINRVQLYTLNATKVRTTEQSFSLSAVLKREAVGSFAANAITFATRLGSAHVDALLLRAATGAASVDATIIAAVGGSFSAAALLNRVSRCVWVSPDNGVQMSDTPVLVFLMPIAATGNMHFRIEIDEDAEFGSPLTYVSHSDLTGWEYWDDAAWQPIPQDGVPNTYCGNEARYTIQTPLENGTWHRRVRAGVI